MATLSLPKEYHFIAETTSIDKLNYVPPMQFMKSDIVRKVGFLFVKISF